MLAWFTGPTKPVLKQARDVLLLVQTRRGHRLGNGKVVASEWHLQIVDSHA